MKKSLENYNNIRLTKRVKSSEDNVAINGAFVAPKNDTNSSLLLETTILANTTLNKKIIFKSKASSITQTKKQQQVDEISSSNHKQEPQANNNSRIKLKRSISDDDDDEHLTLANDPSETKAKQLLVSSNVVKIKLKCSEFDSDMDEEIQPNFVKKESPRLNAKKNSPQNNSQKKISPHSSPNNTVILKASTQQQKTPLESPPSSKYSSKSSPPKSKSPTKPTKSPPNKKQSSITSKNSFTNLTESQQQTLISRRPLVSEHTLLSSDSDTDVDDMDDDELNPLERNIKITSHKKKFIKLIKSSSSSMNGLESSSKSLNTLATTSFSTCASSSFASSSSSSNTNVNNCLSRRKIFSSKRNDSTSFKLNFTHTTESTSNNDLLNNGNGANSLSTNSSRSSSLNSLSQEKNSNIVKILFNSDHTSNSNTEGEEDEDIFTGGSLRNTRKAYECENLGEAQAFQDDLFYLMEGLKSKYKLSERCLCAIKLAEQCLSSEFRMSLRSSSSVDYVNKIFKILNDSNKFKSLALCTSLIMFALTQDKLKISIDKPTFYLMISILNMTSKNGQGSFFSMFLNDPTSLLASPPSSSSMRSSKSTSPSQLSLMNLTVNSETINTKNTCEIDYDENDDIVYKRIYDRCKRVFNQLVSMREEEETDTKINVLKRDTNDGDNDLEENENKNTLDLTLTPKNSKAMPLISTIKDSATFNSQILALECILNFNFNKQNESLSADWFKNEMRDLFVLEKLLVLLKFFLNQYQKEKEKFTNTSHLILNKYSKYINLIVTVTQHPIALNSPAKVNLNQEVTSDLENKIDSASSLNQNYLIDYQNNFLLELLNDSLCLFYRELESLSKVSFNNSKSLAHTNQEILKSALTNSIKQTFLVMINLTHKNYKSSSKLASDKNIVDLIFKCIGSIAFYFDESEQFDILIMSLVILLNIFDTNFKQETTICLVKQVKALNKNSFDVIFNLYKKKEQLVHLAENDQEKEINELNSQIESQNVDNISSTFMNSIGKAGKHMEDHIIAAHSALVIGYMIITDQRLRIKNQGTAKKPIKSLINLDKHKLEMKDNSFKHMAQIIRKFLVFMKIMKCSGFSDDEHIQLILKQLEEI